MQPQSALNVVMEIRPGRERAARAVLERVRANPAENDVVAFGRVPGIHFARFVVLPRANRRVGRSYPPRLVLSSNFDGADRTAHVDALVSASGRGLGELLQNCVGFPEGASGTATAAYLRSHQRRVGALYVNTIGRDVASVAFDARLVDALQKHLDSRDWRGESPEAVRAALLDFAGSRDDLAWPVAGAAETHGPALSLLGKVLGLALLIPLLVLLVLLFPLLLVLLVVLRIHEVGNPPDNRIPRDAEVQTLEADEDWGVQNQLSAVGVLQRGGFRLVLAAGALLALQLAARYYFNRGKLAEIDTIHFARWVLIDGGTRLYFFSNYDGSAESYQDDFVERVAMGLNLVFSNGFGWPRTRYLLFGGAADEQAFKAYYRDHQVPTQAWYVAAPYRGLTAVNVANNAAIRQGLFGSLTTEGCRVWLQRF